MDVNGADQTGNFEEERFNKALHLSALEFIAAGDGVDEDGVLTKSFTLSPVVNVLGIKGTPDPKITGSTENINFFKNLSITELTFNAGGSSNKDVFVGNTYLRPRYIPKPGETEAKTIEALDKAAALAAKSSSQVNGFLGNTSGTIPLSSSVTTEVRNAYTIANAGTNENRIRVFAFPIPKQVTYSTNDDPSAIIKVGKLDENSGLKYDLGQFAIESTGNSTFTGNVKKALSEDGQSYSLNKILRQNGEWSYLKFDVDMLLDHFTPLTDSIKSEAQWNDLVKVYDALVELGAIDPKEYGKENPIVFRLGADVTFTGATIATPKDLYIKLNTQDINVTTNSRVWALTLDNENMTWPANLLTDGSAVINVAENTTLNVGMDETIDPKDDPAVSINAVITNNGVINVGGNSALNTPKPGQPIYNEAGRIVIRYGAYVYPNDGTEGTIAYLMTNSNNEIARINTLLSQENDLGLANINTLMIPEGITLDVNAKVADYDGSGDRYNDDSSVGDPLASLEKVSIELLGGSITGEMGDDDIVKEVTVKEGDTNTMTDVKTSAITVETGTLAVNTNFTDADEAAMRLLALDKITNSGTLNVNTDIDVTEIANPQGTISVGAGYRVRFTTTRQTSGTLTGEGQIYNVNAADSPEAQDVSSTINALLSQSTWSNVDTYNEFVSKMGSSSGDYSNAFLAAFNEWREANGEEAVTRQTLTVAMLLEFERLTSISLGLKYDTQSQQQQ